MVPGAGPPQARGGEEPVGWLSDRPLAGLAVVALAVTGWYLWPGGTPVLVNGALAALALLLPLRLVREGPRSRRRGIAAASWGICGAPGAYVFGTPVLAAAVLAGCLSAASRLRGDA